ncbi:OLC1v1008786C1 [Oldenlandia corymbosa var. corymbosa]|uniref:OLC1v1008786C1 n=1 Tax=Oldenlandia corymbosa var. corymbosa TaxID=529605 RepID=A0AAV1DQ94_OLDCO|nr:OLC1v1008786C1 [Oldenlandia corymbosa var. corymbosa]
MTPLVKFYSVGLVSAGGVVKNVLTPVAGENPCFSLTEGSPCILKFKFYVRHNLVFDLNYTNTFLIGGVKGIEPIDEEAEFDIGFEVNGSETDAADDVEVSINGGTDTTGTQEGDEAAPANKGGRKKRRLTSSVWNHFQILP